MSLTSILNDVVIGLKLSQVKHVHFKMSLSYLVSDLVTYYVWQHLPRAAALVLEYKG